MTKTTVREIQDRISTLANEAAAHQDLDQVALCDRACGRELYDSEANILVGPEELFPGSDTPMVAYVATIIESLDCDQAEGHVRIGNRRVFAH